MKILTAVFLASALSGLAQTNVTIDPNTGIPIGLFPVSPGIDPETGLSTNDPVEIVSQFYEKTKKIVDGNHYVTNVAYKGMAFTITNSDDIVFTNATAVKLFPNKLLYKTASGAEGYVRLDILPQSLQQKFCYDKWSADAADFLDGLNKKTSDENWTQRKQQAEADQHYETLKKEVEENPIGISGRVIQRLNGGLLIDTDINNEAVGDSRWNEFWKAHANDPLKKTILPDGSEAFQRGPQIQYARGIIFLKDYPRQEQMAEGDEFSTFAYHDGFYKYITVNHVESTIHCYTSSLTMAIHDLILFPPR